MEFLDYYRENLAHIRSLSSDFAAEFPKIASRLELNELECRDPYVERLLEGSAFLAARVEQKLESGFPRLLESILSQVSPLAIFPFPSCTVLELHPDQNDERLKNGCRVKSGTQFSAKIPSIKSNCIYSTQHDVDLYPLAVNNAHYYTRDLERFHFSNMDIKAAVSVELTSTIGIELANSAPDELSFYFNVPEGKASMLQELLTIGLEAVYLGTEENFIRCPDIVCEVPVSFEINGYKNIVPALKGLNTLQHFLTYPAAFKFLKVSGLKKYFQQCNTTSAELVFALKRRENSWLQGLEKEEIRLWCVPAVNIFHKRTDRCDVNGQYEYQVLPEHTAPLDYEVFRVLSVEAYNDRNELLFQTADCYKQVSSQPGQKHCDFFSAHRRKRLFNNSRKARSSYQGSEVFLSFSGENWVKNWDSVKQFQAETLCTNRDLPLLLRMDTVLDSPLNIPVNSATFISAPSAPLPPLISQGTEQDWKLSGYLLFNLSSALWLSGNLPAEQLCGLIRSYSCRSKEETERLLEGIVEIRTEPKMFRSIYKGCVFYDNGWRIDLKLNEQQYAGTGVYIFAVIIRELLKSYTPVNSCVELVIHTDQKEAMVTWRLQEK